MELRLLLLYGIWSFFVDNSGLFWYNCITEAPKFGFLIYTLKEYI